MHAYVGIDGQVGEAWREEQIDGLVDPNLQDDFDKAELLSLVELALWCARRRSAERPLMQHVVRRLYDLGLGGTLEIVQDRIDLGDEYDEYCIVGSLRSRAFRSVMALPRGQGQGLRLPTALTAKRPSLDGILEK